MARLTREEIWQLVKTIENQLSTDGSSCFSTLKEPRLKSYLYNQSYNTDISATPFEMEKDVFLQNIVLSGGSSVNVDVLGSEVLMLALTGVKEGDIVVRTDIFKTYINTTGNNTSILDWQEILTFGLPSIPSTFVSSFLDLSDTPDSYTSHSGKSLRVKTNLSGLEFYTPTDISHTFSVPLSSDSLYDVSLLYDSTSLGVTVNQLYVKNDGHSHTGMITTSGGTEYYFPRWGSTAGTLQDDYLSRNASGDLIWSHGITNQTCAILIQTLNSGKSSRLVVTDDLGTKSLIFETYGSATGSGLFNSTNADKHFIYSSGGSNLYIGTRQDYALYICANDIPRIIVDDAAVLFKEKIGIMESTGETYYTYLQAGDQTYDITYTLPITSASTGYLLNTNGTLSWITSATPSVHNILSSTHGDTTSATCVRGDVITGQGVTPTWSRLAVSVPGAGLMNYLGAANGDTEPGYKALFDATVPGTIAESATAATGSATVAARRDHTHGAPATWTPAAHGILDSTYHSDVLTGSITRGDILYGNATPKIARLALGTNGYLLGANATDVVYNSLSGWGIQPLHANLTSLAGLSYGAAAFVKMTGANTFTLDTTTYVTGTPWTGMGYLTANQTITLSGVVTGSGTTAITTSFDALGTAGVVPIFGATGLSASIASQSGGTITMSAAQAALNIVSSTGTNSVYKYFTNTGGNLYIGIDRSTGGSICTGSSAYYAVFNHVGSNAAYNGMHFALGNAIKMTLTATGLGIGLVAPATALNISAAQGSAILQINQTTNANRLQIENNTSGYNFYGEGNIPMRFYTNGTETVEITGGGVLKLDHIAELTGSHGVVFDNKVGIGGTPSMGTLDVLANKAESNMLYLANANASYGSLLTFPKGYIGEYGASYGGTICGINYANLFRITANTNVNFLIDIPGDYPIVFGSNGAEAGRFTDAGLDTPGLTVDHIGQHTGGHSVVVDDMLGCNIAVPTEQLHVGGNVLISGGYYLKLRDGDTYICSTSAGHMKYYATYDHLFYGSCANPLFKIENDGASPAGLVSVGGALAITGVQTDTITGASDITTPTCSRLELTCAAPASTTLQAGDLPAGSILYVYQPSTSSYCTVNGYSLTGTVGVTFIKTTEGNWVCVGQG